jgi:WD40 repeat protein
VVKHFADRRLLVTSGETVELVHDALLREWGRLQDWLRKSREQLRILEAVSEAASAWKAAPTNPDLLVHRGGRLEDALRLHNRLSSQERAYLATCKASQQRRRRNTIAGIVLVVLIVVGTLAGWAWMSNQSATEKGYQVATIESAKATAVGEANARAIAQKNAETEKQNAVKQANIAKINELAALALSNKDERPDLALLLSVEAYNRLENYQTLNSLLTVIRAKPQLLGFLVAEQPVYSVSFSFDGKQLASLGYGGELRLWDVESHRQLLFLQLENRGGYSADYSGEFSPVEDVFVFGDESGITFLEFSDDQPIILSDLPFGPVSSVSFSSNGKMLAIGRRDENTIILLDFASRTVLETLHIQDDGTSQFGIPENVGVQVALSTNGRYLAGSWDNSITIWDVTDLNNLRILETLDMSAEMVTSLEFNPDGSTLVSGEIDGSITFWDTEWFARIGEPVKSTLGMIYDLAFSPDGKILASDGGGPNPRDKAIVLWNARNRTQIKTLIGHSDAVVSVDFNLDGTILASGSADNTIALWKIISDENENIPDYLPMGHLLEAPASLQGNWRPLEIVFSHDMRYLAVNLYSGSVLIWDLSTLSVTRTYSPLGAKSLNIAFNPVINMLAIGTSANQIAILDVNSNSFSCTIDNVKISYLAFSADGETLTSEDEDGNISLWNTENCRLLGQFNNYPRSEYLGSLKLLSAPDSKKLINGENPWDIFDGNLKKTILENCNPDAIVAVNSSGDIIACDYAYSINLIDIIKNQKISRQPLIGHRSPIRDIQFGKDSKMLAASSNDGAIILWDLDTRQGIGQPFIGSKGGVEVISFNPDGTLLASESDNGIILWDVGPDSWRDRACEIVGRNFAYFEWVQYLPNNEYHATCPQWPLEPEPSITPIP